jgi:small subunit ribosomal protein S6
VLVASVPIEIFNRSSLASPILGRAGHIRNYAEAQEETMQLTTHKEYETIYILRSDVDADNAEKLQQRVADVIAREHGKLIKVESWGRRKLAYTVAKQKKGVYMYVKFVGRGGLVQELERNLKLSDHVMKFQTVVLDESVDMAKLTIDPEEAKLAKIELAPEDEEKETRERALGLIVDAPEARHHAPDDDFADDADDAAEKPAADETAN